MVIFYHVHLSNKHHTNNLLLQRHSHCTHFVEKQLGPKAKISDRYLAHLMLIRRSTFPW